MKLKTDTLAVRCYARHGDTCSLAPHCETLGCASKCKPDDYVLVAQFSYLQEASDYCREGASRGVRMHLVSRIVPSQPFHMDYSPSSVNQLDSNTTSAAKSEPEHAAKDHAPLLPHDGPLETEWTAFGDAAKTLN